MIIVIRHRSTLSLFGIDQTTQNNNVGLGINEVQSLQHQPAGELPLHNRNTRHHIVAIIGILVGITTGAKPKGTNHRSIAFLSNDRQRKLSAATNGIQRKIVLIQRNRQNRILARHLKTGIDDATNGALTIESTYHIQSVGKLK